MIRLLLCLGVGLYAVMLVVGSDAARPRLGLAGAYAIDTTLPATPAGATQRTAAAVDTEVAVPAGYAAAVYTPAQPVMRPAAQATPVSAPATPDDIRRVLAQAINVRSGPSTGDAVLDRLRSGEEVLVVADAGDGWVQIRIEGDGIEGYVAARLLSAPGN